MNKKEKAIDPQIVVHGTVEKPYYEISYYDTTDNKWHIGYSSYDLQTVKEYLDNCFEVVDADIEPVKHGKWICMGDCGVTKCSCCGWTIEEYIEDKYCRECGTRMDGDNNER